MPSPLFVVEMEKVVMICDRLDQAMTGTVHVFEHSTQKAFEALHEIARKHEKKCLDAANYSRVNPYIYTPPDYSGETPVSTKSLEKLEASYVEREKRSSKQMDANELDMRLRRILS